MSRHPQAWYRRLPAVFRVLPVLLLLCGAPAVRAQGTGEPGAGDASAEAPATVGRVAVTGNVHTDSTRILRTFDVAPGTKFSQDLVRRGTRKLMALGIFSDARVRQRPHDGVIDLVIEVRERPRLGAIRFSGNKKREDVDLERKLFMHTGETYSATVVQTQVDSLLKYYRDEGFPRTKITPVTDTVATRNELNLTFQVEEGEKFRITRVQFKGATAFPENRLRKVMKTHAKGFFGGGDLKDETWTEDREKLEGWYHNHGYRDMTVADISTVPGDKPKALTLVVTVDEGREYRLGQVGWSGNTVVETPALMKLLGKAKPGARYDKSKVDAAVAAAYGEYAEHGYLYLEVEPNETPHDSLVDVDIAVREGAPSHIRRVSITGNRGTREHVIRRELDVHEGDLFRKSSLVRSQGDVMRLGLFEEVVPDFAPVESTDVDLVFKVKEKQVGTASAGAGYTGQTGLTGFLEIGHNNVLGNGQQLALHLERGNKVENYSLSFTEPWFKDAPTLLGFSAYSTQNILTEYDERRRGASARIGRPLPWPDYSRGSISYTLERVRISNVRDSILLAGVPVGVDQLTSTFETNFLRNSADNPFYPTKGTRLTANDQFTGGPFFGDVNYHLHRYEGRAYLPSIAKRFTTMLRLRVGTVNQYPWKKGAIPDYARFRLGGGSTADPLRGYMDYQIVPPQFITDVVTGRVISSIDSLTTPGVKDTLYRDITAKRRYPGGRYMALFSFEQQFPIVNPLHGVLFFDAGNVWDTRREIQPLKLKKGAGFGFRMEIPILGNVGFDYGYGFDRDDGPRWQGHFLLGNVGF